MKRFTRRKPHTRNLKRRLIRAAKRKMRRQGYVVGRITEKRLGPDGQWQWPTPSPWERKRRSERTGMA